MTLGIRTLLIGHKKSLAQLIVTQGFAKGG